MKKLMIITTATCLFFVSCSKGKLQPNPTINEVSQKKQTMISPIPVSTPKKYVITNTESDLEVIRDYRLTYTDLNGRVQEAALAPGKSITLCLNSPDIRTNFTYDMALLGNCR